ncbi:MAG: SGNH/GDSL hydrolase family protein [Planctomycetes bacterium]|nr:SGNH/GDSL hydrolase family protein [Planctomycetota bacterium]MCC7397437.1 SGNH/GDSL hydrolase family protein [Planctomycetota bacterium]
MLLLLLATTFAALVGEIALRLFVPPVEPLGRLSYADGDGKPVTREEAVGRGLIVPLTAPRPMDRPRLMFAPGQRFYLCYTDNDRLRRDWLDAEGRVEVRINRFGLRERDEITPDKPPGQRRIVCIGDSFTFGWGIPEEMGWVRGLERELRASGDDWRTVNCGAAGTVCIDEYWWGLKERFHVFQPDAVILTICLNDLIPSSGLNVIGPQPRSTGSRLLDLVRGAFTKNPLDLDPGFDWVGALLALPKADGEAAGLYDPTDKPFEAMWSQGVPQSSLREAKAWCEARKVPLLVVLWPFLQGLGPGRHYPFTRLHELVAADCAAAGIPLLDVLPALRDHDDEELWVTPADQHPNPRAEQLALPAIVGYAKAHLR